MKKKLLAGLITGLFIYGIAITHINAATFTFSGTITEVLIDNNSGTYSGTAVGDSFSGNFVYGDNADEASNIYTEPNERDWEFKGGPFSASITDGVTPTNFSIVNINIQNDWPLDAKSINFLALFGQNKSLGTPIDTWSSGGITEGAFWIDAPTPGDPDNENLANGMIMQVAFVSYDTTLYSGLDYQPLQPSTADLSLFLIEEADAAGNTLYSAVGLLTTIIPSDYMIAGNIGDTWTYANLDGSQFTWTLSEVVSGPNAGLLERGNDDSGMVYDLTNNVLTIHEWNKTPIDPPWNLAKIGLGQIDTLNDDPDDPSMYLFWKVPSITVQAGTFNDVLALVWLDDSFLPNSVNTELELNPNVAAAVTDIDYFVCDIGQIAYRGVEASTGESDGGFELVSTTVLNWKNVDFNNDGDVDGTDLVVCIENIQDISIENFAQYYGKSNECNPK